MVFACTGQPQALKALDERLRSRLESGLVVELMEPDLDVRMRCTQAARAKSARMNLSREQLLFSAQRCSQFRLLPGAAAQVAAFCSVTGCELSQADREHCADRCQPTKLGVSGNSRCGGPGHEFAPRDVWRQAPARTSCWRGKVSMYICRRKLGLSYPELGRAFGGKDHSTVIYAIKKIKKILVSDKALQQLVTELELKAQ